MAFVLSSSKPTRSKNAMSIKWKSRERFDARAAIPSESRAVSGTNHPRDVPCRTKLRKRKRVGGASEVVPSEGGTTHRPARNLKILTMRKGSGMSVGAAREKTKRGRKRDPVD